MMPPTIHYCVAFCNEKFCQERGIEVVWHLHRPFDTRDKALENADTLRRSGFPKVRVFRLIALDEERDEYGRFRKQVASERVAAWGLD